MARIELIQIQIISGTEIMVNMNHARQIEFSMPLGQSNISLEVVWADRIGS